MELLRSLIEQARTLWAAASNPGRFAFVATLVVCTTTIVGVGYWSSRPQYIAMASELAPSQSAEIISKLASEKISYETNISGSTVYVPKHELSRARSVCGNLIEGSPSESLSSGFLTDPSELPYRLLRIKEQSLERTISQMTAVSSADVHIAQPQWTPYPRDQQATTASVVLGLRPRSNFGEQHAGSIAALIASSVEGLETGNVTITDLNGNILWGESSQHGNDIARQLDFQQQLETRKSAEAETMLRTLLGPGKAIVKVAADLNFTQRETVKTTYDPDEKVKIRETIDITTTSNSRPTSPGRTRVHHPTSPLLLRPLRNRPSHRYREHRRDLPGILNERNGHRGSRFGQAADRRRDRRSAVSRSVAAGREWKRDYQGTNRIPRETGRWV